MSSSLDSSPARHGTAAAVASAAAREGILEVAGEVALHHGGRLPGMSIAWRMTGPANAPVLVALGGISGGRRVFSLENPKLGWWGEIVGPGRALGVDEFRILSFDYLGGSGETTGPRPGETFPSVSSYDQADVLLRLMNHLGLKSLKAIVGASYGAMVALTFAERHPDRVAQLLVISGADRTHPMSTAWRSIQRRIMRFGAETGRPEAGVELARALAMATYRSPEEFAARFAGAPKKCESGFVFPVEEYLCARGAEYAARHRAEGFICLSESIDLHRVDASRVFVPTVAVAVREDQLVPLGDMRAMVARLPNARLLEISSVYGHDAFLKEAEQLRPIFAATLASTLSP